VLFCISLASVSFVLAEVAERANGLSPSLFSHVLNVVVYSLVGVIVLGASFLVIKRMMPFSVTKEIEQDQNVALAIVIGSVIIGMSMIISAAIL
jgi:putative membrane protein